MWSAPPFNKLTFLDLGNGKRDKLHVHISEKFTGEIYIIEL